MEKKKFVEIQSDITIKVTAGLQYSDYTDKTLALPNKLNVKPRWVDTSILIRQGKHVYPSEVVGWQTVKALEAKNILTIGKFVDDADEDVKQEAIRLEKALDTVKKSETKKLKDIGEN